jgi:H+/Cl- antiporter ClcA
MDPFQRSAFRSRNTAKTSEHRPTRVRFYLVAGLIGILAGLVGAGFHAILDLADQGRSTLVATLRTTSAPGWLILMGLGALMLVSALWIVRRFAPETAGSGVQEVEAVLAGQRGLRWQRVLPVKFVAGAMAIGTGLVLGREGPTIHMGAALGQLASERAGMDAGEGKTLVAVGAAAGLAAAFNAPLAAIVFVTEELREHVQYSFAAIQSVALACCAAVAVSGWMLGQGPDLPIANLSTPPLHSLPMFLVLGVLVGALGALFNRVLIGSVRSFRALRPSHGFIAAALVGMILGALLWLAPEGVGGGEQLVQTIPGGSLGLLALLTLLALRLLTTIGSYGVGVPGGIFAPLLALGTLAGAAFAASLAIVTPAMHHEPELFAVAAMGALFAATVRAPLTGIILVIELTGAHMLALPIILTCLTATFTAEAVGGRPIYALLLRLGEQGAPRRPVSAILVGALLLATVVTLEPIAVTPHDPRMAKRLDDATSVTNTGAAADADASRGAPSGPQERTAEVARHSASGSDGSIPGADLTQAQSPDHQPAWAEPDGTGASEAPQRPAAIAPSPPPEPLTPRYSIQLISFREPASLRRFARSHALGQAMTLSAPSASGLESGSGARWHALLIGDYASRDDAQAALERLPANLKSLEPLIRQLATDERLIVLD